MPEKTLKTCLICGKKLVNMAAHLRAHRQQKPHECTLCPKAFSEKGNLTRHIRTAHSATSTISFKCNICEKSFIRNDGLVRHVKEVHEKNKRFPCTFCNKLFLTKALLRLHILCYIEEKPYSCEFCGKDFVSIANRDIHSRIHAQGAMHKCRRCHKLFANLSELQLHEKAHQDQDDRPRPHKCSTCGATFLQKWHLKSHQTVHNLDSSESFKCKNGNCSKTFKYLRSLQHHEKVAHGNEKPQHICVFCSKGFHTKKEFHWHILSHLKEKPFACIICDAAFSQSNIRNRHVRWCCGTVPGPG